MNNLLSLSLTLSLALSQSNSFLFHPMHRMPPYKHFRIAGESYPVSSGLSDGGISLPSSIYVEEVEIRRVCNVLCSNLRRIKKQETLDFYENNLNGE